MRNYLSPPKKKFRKYHKVKYPNGEYKNTTLNIGNFGLKSLENKLLSSNNLETLKKTILKILKKKAKLFIKIFPDIPVTKKPQEVRMGKGKGNVSHWVTKIGCGQIIAELDVLDITDDLALAALIEAGKKLPLKVKVLKLNG